MISVFADNALDVDESNKWLLTEFIDHRLQLLQIRRVLIFILNLLLDSLQNPHCRSIIIHFPTSFQSSLNNVHRGNQIIGETIVESSLEFENVGAVGEEGVVSRVEIFVGFVFTGVRARAVSEG